jgi:hypothetical protein
MLQIATKLRHAKKFPPEQRISCPSAPPRISLTCSTVSTKISGSPARSKDAQLPAKALRDNLRSDLHP